MLLLEIGHHTGIDVVRPVVDVDDFVRVHRRAGRSRCCRRRSCRWLGTVVGGDLELPEQPANSVARTAPRQNERRAILMKPLIDEPRRPPEGASDSSPTRPAPVIVTVWRPGSCASIGAESPRAWREGA